MSIVIPIPIQFSDPIKMGFQVVFFIAMIVLVFYFDAISRSNRGSSQNVPLDNLKNKGNPHILLLWLSLSITPSLPFCWRSSVIGKLGSSDNHQPPSPTPQDCLSACIEDHQSYWHNWGPIHLKEWSMSCWHKLEGENLDGGDVVATMEAITVVVAFFSWSDVATLVSISATRFLL